MEQTTGSKPKNETHETFWGKYKTYLYIAGGYLFFLVIVLNISNFITIPENDKFLESILAFAGGILTLGLTFAKEKVNEFLLKETEKTEKEEKRKEDIERDKAKSEQERKLKLYEQKLKISEEFLKTLEEIVKDNIVSTERNNPNEDELKKYLFLISKLRIYFSQSSVELILKNCGFLIQAINDSKNRKLDYSTVGDALFSISVILKEELDHLSDEKDSYNSKSPETPEKPEERNSIVGALKDFIGTLAESSDYESADDKSIKTWHVNIGESSGLKPEEQYRCWDDMKKFNFWSAGGGERYALGAQKLKVDDTIYAYISKKGYVGKGVVKEKAVLVGAFKFKDNTKNADLTKDDFKSEDFLKHLKDTTFLGFHDEKIGEYAVRVEWKESRDRDKAFYNEDLKISPLTICSMFSKNRPILEKEFKEKK